MSSGFISGGTTDAPIERDSEWIIAQQEIEATRRRKEEESRQTDGKTLYDTLQANKAAKQEAFEESIRLKNQFRSLDEDEVEFLDSVLESTRTREEEIRRETAEQLDLFRRQQEEADKALLVEAAADGDGVGGGGGDGAVLGEQWAVSGKKRRRGRDRQVLKGVKIRKTSAAGDAGASQPEEHGTPARPVPEVGMKGSGVVPRKQRVQETNIVKTGTITDAGGAKSATVPKPPPADASVPANKSAAVLGLGNYSSDDDE